MLVVLKRLSFVIALAALITACSPAAGADPTDEVPTEEPTTEPTEVPDNTGPAGRELAGTSWRLVEIMNEAPIAGTEITLDFSETEIGGRACNSYFGSYTTDAAPEGQEWAQGLITISQVGSTDMACMEPEGAMEQETAYFNILQQVSGYRIEPDGRLVLEHPTMDPCCLVYEPVTPIAGDTDSLNGLSATLIDLNGTAPLEGNPITISFAGGQASGSAGCNQFNTTYSVADDGSVAFGPVITTKMACADDGAMEQEGQFVALLETMTRYEGIAADALTLTNDNGETLRFALNMEASVSSPVSLVGTEWVLWSLNGASPLAGTEITIAFEDAERLGGFGGCNNYGAAYQIGENSQIAIQSPDRTEMLCEGSSDQENVYFDSLVSITSYEFTDPQTLAMYGETTTLIWTLRPHSNSNPADLVGTNWLLMEIDDVALGEGFLVPTLNFIEEGKVEGAGGCRPYEATYVAEGDKISFTSMNMLADTCESGDDLEFEQNFTTLLSTATMYLLDGDRLIIYSDGGHRMVFERG